MEMPIDNFKDVEKPLFRDVAEGEFFMVIVFRSSLYQNAMIFAQIAVN